jgi:hypothetical protein
MFDVSTSYVNGAVKALVTDLEQIIRERDELDCPAVRAAMAEFDRTCRTVPAVVSFLKQRTAVPDGCTTILKCHLELLMLSMIARSSSTYGTIPGIVAHLALVGEHEDAAILNENARNETGDRSNRPHAVLLYRCFRTLGKTFGIRYPTPASYHIARQIRACRQLSQTTLAARWMAARKFRAVLS